MMSLPGGHRAFLFAAFALCACERAPSPAARAPSSAGATSGAVPSVAARAESAASVPAIDTAPVSVAPGDTLTSLVVDSALTEPRLDALTGAFVLRVPPRMYAALQTVVPGFDTFRRGEFAGDMVEYFESAGRSQALFAVVGDFDGDRRRDAAVYGTAGRDVVLAVVLDDASDAKVAVVRRGRDHRYDADDPGRGPDGDIDQFIVLQARGPVKSDWLDAPLRLANEGFQLVIFEKAAVLYYYRGGKFVEVVTSD